MDSRLQIYGGQEKAIRIYYIMFKWFWRKEVKIIIRDKELQRLTDLLFPPLERIERDGDLYQVDYSVDMNLDSALQDLKDGSNDKTTQETISRVLDRLIEARKILNAYPVLDENTKFLIVDNLPNEKEKEINPSQG